MIGTILTITASAVCGVLFVTHDPPSGYNMGTGDSWYPFLYSLCGIALGIFLYDFGI
jgi:hypothetical protein